MRTALLSAANEAAERVTTAARDTPGSTTIIGGPAGTGRSLVLEVAATKLIESGLRVVVVQPPPRHYDTAGLALVDTAVGLATSGLAPPVHRVWRMPATWHERTLELRGWLKEAAAFDDFVLVLDDPARWAIPESSDVEKRLEAAADLLLREVDCTRVVVSGSDNGHTAVRLRPLAAAEVFDRPDDWRTLADAASRVGADHPELAARTPADIGFVVALATLTSPEEVHAWWDPRLTTEHLADRLVDHVRGTASLRRLWSAWLAASVPRRATPDGFPPEVERLSDRDRDVFDVCLLAVDGRRLAREARAAAWRAATDLFASRVRVEATRRLHRLYLDDFEAAASADDPRQLTVAAEAIHTAGRLGAVDSIGALPAVFSDQLTAVGMGAIERSDWDAAVAAFDLALEVDSDDAVARHNLGFSLDNQATEPRRVERSYELAIELDPTYATWHARLICFLVVQARIGDADRRWGVSRAQLIADEGDSPPELYARLHLPVAAHLLRRAELGMTYKVLADVPPWAQPHVPGYGDHWHRFQVLESAQDTSAFIPAYRAAADWWRRGPELLSERHPDGRPLGAWFAAGVESLHDDGIALTVAIVRGPAEPATGTTTLTWDQLRDFAVDTRRAEALDVGDFLEIGYYGQGAELASDPVVRVLPRSDWLAGLPTGMDPARYIHRAIW